MKIIAYTDGCSLGNPGPGGYGVVLLLPEKNYKREIKQGFVKTTNNRMELLAAIVALESLRRNNQEITIYTDSKYVHDSVEKKWVFAWQKKSFVGKKNADLWRRFLQVYAKQKVEFQWVKGHAGDFWNERADALANQAAKDKNLLVDEGFISKQSKLL